MGFILIMHVNYNYLFFYFVTFYNRKYYRDSNCTKTTKFWDALIHSTLVERVVKKIKSMCVARV